MKHPRRKVDGGLTLVELLVAMAISLIVVIAGASVLVASRQGFSTVDAASQLRDSGRFAADLINRIVAQSGFRDVEYAATMRRATGGGASNPDPPVYGANDARPVLTDPAHSFTPGGVNGSDVLVIRYQVPETFPGSGTADPSMVDCNGQSAPNSALPQGRDDMWGNVIYVDTYKGEPTLMCVTISTSGTVGQPQPMVKGVEDFQVLFGSDGVTAGTAPTLATDSVLDSLLRADQLEVPADPVNTNANWRRVRAIRVGMVLRASAGSAADSESDALFPLGRSMSAAADAGSSFSASADHRLRQVVTFTVHLRNDQTL